MSCVYRLVSVALMNASSDRSRWRRVRITGASRRISRARGTSLSVGVAGSFGVAARPHASAARSAESRVLRGCILAPTTTKRGLKNGRGSCRRRSERGAGLFEELSLGEAQRRGGKGAAQPFGHEPVPVRGRAELADRGERHDLHPAR